MFYKVYLPWLSLLCPRQMLALPVQGRPHFLGRSCVCQGLSPAPDLADDIFCS
uniref:Uncharacterized protein n=1 Tax=Mus musculus TaxID=10090 RepID=Q3UX86_MOUSE|nr:unnamed protein product [Mus musculus]